MPSPPQPSDHDAKLFHLNGFVVIRQFLTGSEFDLLNENLERYVRDVAPTLPDSDAFYQDKNDPGSLKQLHRMGSDPFFANLRRHPRWSACATLLLGEPVSSRDPEWFNKPPGATHPTPPHQDNYYFNLTPPHALTAWLALDPADQHNGCLRYVAGSHRRGKRPHAPTQVLGFSQGICDYDGSDRDREVEIHLQPGDLAIHHCETIHRAEPNTSQRPRRAFAIVFQGESCQQDDAAHRRYLEASRQQQSSMGLELGTDD